MDVVELSNERDLLDFLRLSNSRWQLAQVTATTHTWVFRGQGDARWGLVPKSLRASPKAMTDRALPLPWRAAETELSQLHTFLDIADEVGVLPHPFSRFPDFYSQIVRAFNDHGAPAPNYADELLEAFALAQHHGVNTRLLDWSASPLTAAFFAAQDAFESDDDRTAFAIWAMPRQRPGDNRIKVITPSRTLNRFAHRQTGYLSIDVEVDKHYQDGGGWPSQDNVLDEYQRAWGNGKWPCLRKIVVPRACAEDLLLDLYQEGISRAHLMPTLDNVSQTMRLRGLLMPRHLERSKERWASLDQDRGK